MRRLLGALLVSSLWIPASLSLPSARTAAGASCAMSCSHRGAKACCCETGGAGASLRRCAGEDGGLIQAPFAKSVVPVIGNAVGAPQPSGVFLLATAGLLLRAFAERPDPVPRFLS